MSHQYSRLRRLFKRELHSMDLLSDSLDTMKAGQKPFVDQGPQRLAYGDEDFAAAQSSSALGLA